MSYKLLLCGAAEIVQNGNVSSTRSYALFTEWLSVFLGKHMLCLTTAFVFHEMRLPVQLCYSRGNVIVYNEKISPERVFPFIHIDQQERNSSHYCDQMYTKNCNSFSLFMSSFSHYARSSGARGICSAMRVIRYEPKRESRACEILICSQGSSKS